jgi:hypothetical protein
MRRMFLAALFSAAFILAKDIAVADTIALGGAYNVSVVAQQCARAGGTRTNGIGPGGFGCKTEQGEVECTEPAGALPSVRRAVRGIAAPGFMAF